MIRKECGGKSPQVAPTARGAENITLIGDVQLGEDVSIWYGAVLRGDEGRITVGNRCNIQDNCVLHCGYDEAVTLGQDVVVGHGAIVHGCTVEDGCLIGMGVTLLNGCVIGAGSIVAAGALVPQGKLIPPGSLVMGVPAKVVRPVTEEEQRHTLDSAAHYVEQSRCQLERILQQG